MSNGRDSDSSLIDYGIRAGKRFNVWSQPTDAYDREQLAENWDLLDGIIGRPVGGGQWPPNIGEGAGIYGEIQKILDGAASVPPQMPLGSIVPWFYPGSTIPTAVRNELGDLGWVVCDGTIVASGDHEFAAFSGSFRTPNLTNMFIIGANIDGTRGAVSSPTAASGMVTTSVGTPGNTGQTGSNSVAPHTHTVPTHTHPVPQHTHSIPAHSHQVPDHLHYLGNLTGGVNIDAQGGRAGEVTKDGTGTTHTSAFKNHVHNLPGSTGGTHPGPPGYVAGQKFDTLAWSGTTGLNAVANTGSNTVQTTGPNSVTPVDNRPASVPLVYIMKVRNTVA